MTTGEKVRRFYIHPDQVKGPAPHLSGREARHLRLVLRMSVGDPVVLFDGTGMEYSARIISLHSDRVNLELLETHFSPTEPSINLTVAQAFLKKRKMDGLVRQLTEIGIHHWQPFTSHRSIPRPNNAKQHTLTKRWEAIAIEATKQCRRSRPPKVSPLGSFDDLLTTPSHHSVRIILWEKATEPLINQLPPPHCSDQSHHTLSNQDAPNENTDILLMLGPEGGFTESEVEMARSEGFITATLGPRILRAETAALAATVITMHHMGELS